MASPQANAIKELYSDWLQTMAAQPDLGLDAMRDMFEHWGDITGEPGDIDYVEVEAGGVPAMWAIPKGAVENRVALCTHGGGYVCGSMYTHRKLFGHIAKAIGCPVGRRASMSPAFQTVRSAPHVHIAHGASDRDPRAAFRHEALGGARSRESQTNLHSRIGQIPSLPLRSAGPARLIVATSKIPRPPRDPNG